MILIKFMILLVSDIQFVSILDELEEKACKKKTDFLIRILRLTYFHPSLDLVSIVISVTHIH